MRSSATSFPYSRPKRPDLRIGWSLCRFLVVAFQLPALASLRPAIDALPDHLRQGDILNVNFLLGREERLAGYYAPLDAINLGARIVLLGLTPGWKQTKIAFEAFRRALSRGSSEDEVFKAAKGQASFAGMRPRLCRWLDDLGVPAWLGISRTEDLFDAHAELLHTTSAIRYPVFVGDGATNNYTGHGPAPLDSPLLMSIIESVLLPELTLMPDALVVPMGRSVSATLAGEGVSRSRCLFGFPHPSGANGHGPKQFLGERVAMQAVVEALAARPRR